MADCPAFGHIYLFNAYVYGNIITYRAVAPNKTAFMAMRMRQFQNEGKDVALDYRWVPYDRISVNLKKALIASEDAKFAEHGGFDWGGINTPSNATNKAAKSKQAAQPSANSLPKPVFERKPQLCPQRRRSRNYRDDGSRYRQRPHFRAVSERHRMALRRIRRRSRVPVFLQRPAANLTKQQAAKLAARVPAPLFYADNPKANACATKPTSSCAAWVRRSCLKAIWIEVV